MNPLLLGGGIALLPIGYVATLPPRKKTDFLGPSFDKRIMTGIGLRGGAILGIAGILFSKPTLATVGMGLTLGSLLAIAIPVYDSDGKRIE